jgi:CheY-like chemotaxis protein
MNHLPHILLVEDQRLTATLIQSILRDLGHPHQLTQAADGQEAIALLSRPSTYAPDLVLLDLHMPNVSGMDVLAFIKRHVELRTVPVVMMSASEYNGDIHRAYQLHVNAFVKKAEDAGELAQTLDAICKMWLQIAVRPAAVRLS